VHQRHARRVIHIDLIAREAGDHHPFGVRAEPKLIRVCDWHPPPHGPGTRVQEQHLVAARIAHQELAPVRAKHQMVRLPQDRHAAYLVTGHIKQAKRRIARIDNDCDRLRGPRRNGQQQHQD